MFHSFQSGFSKHHSRGSVLLKCQMISSVDSGNSVILLLLDSVQPLIWSIVIFLFLVLNIVRVLKVRH